MQYDAYYQLLARADVKELALQSHRPPCVLLGGEYRPVTNHAATEDEILALLAETGRAEMLSLMDGHRKWTFEHPQIGTIQVSAGYHGAVLQARIKLDASAIARQGSTPMQKTAASGFNPGSSMADLSFMPATGPAPQSDAEAEFPSMPAHGSSTPARQSHREAQPSRDDPPARPGRSAPQPPTVRQGNAKPTRGDQPSGEARATRGDQAANDFEPTPRSAATRIDPSRNAVIETATPQGTPIKPARRQALDDIFDQQGASPGDLTDDLPVPDSDRGRTKVDRRQDLNGFLKAAREQKASDLHILADRTPTLRVAGDLVPVGDALPASYVEDMLLPAVPERVMQDLVQHGACDFALQSEQFGRFRANVTRQRTGYKMTARPIPTQMPTLQELGLPEAIASATHHHQGLIVVTGPTGHGKTTTLAAIVNLINSEKAHHIITVEDPIEYVHPRKLSMMSQREVGTHTRQFATALKGSLREDPDVIVVGELRDTETVRMALSASETGHLVISTMNTPSAAKAIERLIDLFPPGDQPQVRLTLAGGLRLIISQRLVPNVERTAMVVAAELLPGSPPLWALIRDGKTFQIPSLQQRGKALGIVRLDDSLAELVRSGKTTMETARSYAESPADFDAVVSGRSNRGGEEQLTIENIDPTQAAAAAATQKAKEVFSRAGKFFGSDGKK